MDVIYNWTENLTRSSNKTDETNNKNRQDIYIKVSYCNLIKCCGSGFNMLSDVLASVLTVLVNN